MLAGPRAGGDRPGGDHRPGHRARRHDGHPERDRQPERHRRRPGTSSTARRRATGRRPPSRTPAPAPRTSRVSANLTGLTGGTTYHYRIVATSTAGTTNGSDGIFTTSAAPTVIDRRGDGDHARPAATLNGSVNPNGQATTYYFEYGKDTNYGSKTTVDERRLGHRGDHRLGGDLRPPGRPDLPLPARRDERRRHEPGRRRELHRHRERDRRPPTVTTKAATSITSTSARLNGTVNPNGHATTYYFEYGPSTSYGSKTTTADARARARARSASRRRVDGDRRRASTTSAWSPRAPRARPSAAT